MLAHPARAAANTWAIGQVLLRGLRGAAAPQSSINRPVAPGRRVRFARFELAAVKDAAHGSGGKVNDVVLDLAAGALRELLLGRGERLDGIELVASIPVSLRSAEQARGLGNAIGVIAVPLPGSPRFTTCPLSCLMSVIRDGTTKWTSSLNSFAT